ncbi:uncharacterized protein RAG0_11529 [Rhynchosporium agropyri]|uniref:RING-type domain-containing protein n=1 Tax=Rhynchosporium agropyri TaxID=914238 RepID=A0A1E1L4M6_9HELO|nr:uncharacterized protein RAG0_11529 [Rhynchosporium agropyri]
MSSTFSIIPVLRGTPPLQYQESSFQTNLNENLLRYGPQPPLGVRRYPSTRNSSTMMPSGMAQAFQRMLRAADAELDLLALNTLNNEFSRNNGLRVHRSANTSSPEINAHPSSCVICTEDFSDDRKPPPCISLACVHEPSVCGDCFQEFLEHELNNKLWNKIACPECGVFLAYKDIKRLANVRTFSRYEVLSLRSALASDDNFAWCRACDFGQVHTGSTEQPIVRCNNCGFRSCFQHSVPWHDRLTCDEYDEMLRDPDSFESAVDKANEAVAQAIKKQEDEDEAARQLAHTKRIAEEARQKVESQQKTRRAQIQQEKEKMKRRLEEESLSLQAAPDANINTACIVSRHGQVIVHFGPAETGDHIFS